MAETGPERVVDSPGPARYTNRNPTLDRPGRGCLPRPSGTPQTRDAGSETRVTAFRLVSRGLSLAADLSPRDANGFAPHGDGVRAVRAGHPHPESRIVKTDLVVAAG